MNRELPKSPEGAPPLTVQVWGKGALFTRPELKVERVTYPVMTPTAAIGVLEAIFWKPEFGWRPVAIDVLEPIHQFTQKRNETTDLVMLEDAVKHGTTVDSPGKRTQRNSVCLRKVSYRIHAHVELREHATKPEAAYRDQFRRRVERGQCFHQPYLGTREFSAHFGPADDTTPEPITADLGIMLHSVHYGEKSPSFSWFTARLESGRMHIPRTGINAGVPVEA
ncbi:type I-C CRISPR-associated protein Cas5c [Actinopolyspora mortivallis]|uniref:pre-crRNA processing endonuclease n=1 Tax=Actinopolyspora mortivallis TaxID=33906 RepID=A0A2T0GZN7_ACTMO|nr:type I-C CRISPR-associated protein Cas5c [Actinopolyspora mortivallis]PRW64550.1 type I-C CRISPR-associated protein Cas5 [Actinopolyspora mortivallis]